MYPKRLICETAQNITLNQLVIKRSFIENLLKDAYVKKLTSVKLLVLKPLTTREVGSEKVVESRTYFKIL